jgi:transcriptional regulator with XRE-family HTH domain
MKNTTLSQKLKELRSQKGLSQEQLADSAQINLRTVQRIERGETEPRGDTLKRLAIALNITPDELIDWAEHEDNSYLVFFNLSALSFLAIPLMGIIVPLALWFLKKDKIKGLYQNGKFLLNFQITWCLAYYLPRAFFTFAIIFHWQMGSLNLGSNGVIIYTLLIFAFYGINIIYIGLSAYRSYRGRKVFYIPAIPFIR